MCLGQNTFEIVIYTFRNKVNHIENETAVFSGISNDLKGFVITKGKMH